MSIAILKELESTLPKDAEISEMKFEASELVLYTKSKEFFRNGESVIKEIVDKLKKRIELRPDPSITVDPEDTKKVIKEIVPEEAGIQEIYFEPELGKVIIGCLKPGLVIGKGGETYRKIKNETLWLPKIERTPAIKSDVVMAVRALLHTEIDYRKKFLNKVGQAVSVRKEVEDEWVRLSCLGSCRHVGRSAFIVQTPYSNVLLDFGLSTSSDMPPHIDAPEFSIDKIDAIVLSHAHLDHCGFIPYLYENGYTGPLYCTPPTRDLMVLLCLDYVDVAQKEGKKAWYSKSAVEKAVKHSITLEYGEVSDITQDMRLTLQPAGHLLGSSLVHLHVGKGLHNILYTGDLKYCPTRLFDPSYTDFKRIETLIIEATYGRAGDVTQPRPIAEKEMLDTILKTVERGGKILIPSFAVGRAQEVMAILGGMDFQYPVYIEGMIWDATAIHTAYPEYMSRSLQNEIFHKGKNPFLADIFHNPSPRERDGIIDSAGPAVILATSGMLVGGPALEYLKGFAPDPKNTLMFVGYQGEGTLGRKILSGQKEVPVSVGGRNKTITIEMEVKSISGLSGHSDRNQLMNFMKRLGSRPERIITNHGDKTCCIELARDAHKVFGVETIAPKTLDVIRLR
ncbi:MAG: beta-CASP ribonuclease aCPSF1 [Candidatus Aenigmarchaeota archaeon]|nr:beta-CASP ribonuclease aCPSF1 [Candidatus Aenigmarchaeota archaeon]